MSVSIIAGPSANLVVEILARTTTGHRISLFTAPPGARPEELIRRIKAIAESRETDWLILQAEEGTPAMAYASLFLENDSSSTLAGVCRLARVAFATGSSTVIGGGTCSVAEQLEFSGDIFIEPATDATFGLARSIALTLNPAAEVGALTETAVSRWAANTNASFNFADALNGAGWRNILEGGSAVPEQPRIAFLPYRARKPFHPERLWGLLQHGLDGVFRAKGFFWLATRMDHVGGLNLAGSELHCSSAGKWWAARDQAAREADMPERTRNEWEEPFGDRRQSLAVMALDIDPNILRSRLDACLLTDSELAQGETSWLAFPDPFPSWSSHGHAHHHHTHDECDHDHGDGHECCHH